jgi:hypothetical protein
MSCTDKKEGPVALRHFGKRDVSRKTLKQSRDLKEKQQLRRLKDVIYINSNTDKNLVKFYGIQFKDFIKYTPNPIDNVLLIEHEYSSEKYHVPSRFMYTTKENIDDLANDDIYNYGNFCWVDFNEETSLDLLKPQEIAELLYLGHKYIPLNSSSFPNINNQYAYCAHDDGWICLLYCRNIEDFSHVITNYITGNLSTSKRRKIYPFNDDLRLKLLEISLNGLLIDFDKLIKTERTIEIPIYQIGKYDDMDEMYNDIKIHRNNSKNKAWLVQKNRKWSLETY